MKPARKQRRVFPFWLLFSLLCLWGATRWLLPGGDTSEVQASSVLAAGCVLAASSAWGLAMRGPAVQADRRALLRAAAGGACWLLGLQLPLFFPGAGISSTSRSIALALCPVVIAVAESALGRTESLDLPGRLWPGLAAVGGLLLLLPEPSFASWIQVVVLAGMPLLAGIGAALISGTHLPLRRLAAVALTGACVPAIAAAALGMASTHGEEARFAGTALGFGTAGEAISLLLALAVLAGLGARRWAASLVIVPLLVALQGVLMLHPEIGARGFLGMSLLGLASLFLLWGPDQRSGGLLSSDMP